MAPLLTAVGPGDVTQEKLDQQADIYRGIIDTCLSIDACKSIVMWGFTDLYSYWILKPIQIN